MAEAGDKKREIAPTSMSPQVRLMLGFYLLALMVALLYLLITTWPEKEGTAGLFLCGLILGKEGRILLLVSFAGALGACIHGATSFIYFCGKGQLLKSWGWWYIFRPFIGGQLSGHRLCCSQGLHLNCEDNPSGCEFIWHSCHCRIEWDVLQTGGGETPSDL